jgi:hypothetical protein
MNIWLRLSATFHEHPKMLAVRAEAGSKADSAELGWYRLLMAAKRYGRWTFASEEHLAYVAGAYYRFVPMYRRARLLDDLTVHDGESYNAIKTDAERKAEQRERDKASRESVTNKRDMARDQSVTLEEREEREEREDTKRESGRARPSDDLWSDPEWEALVWLQRHGCDIRPGNGYHQKLVVAVERHGINAVIGMMDRLAEAGTRNGDVKGFLFGAIDALDSRSRPKTSDLEKGDREEERERVHRARLEKTRRETAELRAALASKDSA